MPIPKTFMGTLVQFACCSKLHQTDTWRIFFARKKKLEDFNFKLEEVVETKVAYFYTLSPKNSKVPDHDSNPS